MALTPARAQGEQGAERGPGLARRLAGHPLFLDLYRRPGLLLRELAWRWATGGLLFALAGFAAWRVWTASLPAVRATGLLLFTPDSLLADPLRLVNTLLDSYRILLPAAVHAALGLAPLGMFVWVCAFAVGRAGVLARFDPRLPRRPWLLAESEGVRILGLAGSAFLWWILLRAVSALLFHGEAAHVLLYGAFLLATGWVYLRFTARFRRAVAIATCMALVSEQTFSRALRRAWQLDEHTHMVPLRRAVSRVRLFLLAAALLLAFVPAPFALGWPLVVWWILLSLPPLAAADAWRLGATFALLRALQEEKAP